MTDTPTLPNPDVHDTNPDAQPPLPAIIATGIPASMGMDPQKVAKLARELVMDMKEADVILKSYGLTIDQFKAHIEHNPFFKRVLETYSIEWNGALSTQQRLKVQAATALEESLQDLAVRMNSKDEALPAVVETAKLFAKIAEVGEQSKHGNSAGEKFSITINLGEDTKLKFEKDVTPTPPLIVQEAKDEQP